jgi:hypothetical protein
LSSGEAQAAVPTRPPAVVTSVTVRGNLADPTITIRGSHFGKKPHSTPTFNCSNFTGRVFGMTGLWLHDNTKGWTAGQFDTNASQSNCIGLFVSRFTSSRIVFRFGNCYDSQQFPEFVLSAGDEVTVQVKDSAPFTETIQ